MNILTIVLPEYPVKIQMTNKRKPIYYIRGQKIPKYCFEKNSHELKPEYSFRKIKLKGVPVQVLYKGEEPLFKNARSKEKPRFELINTQRFYSGYKSEFVRMAIVEELKNYFKEQLKDIKPFDKDTYPIHTEFIFHTHMRLNADTDNVSWIYIKVFHDSLKELNIIPDDHSLYIKKYSAEMSRVESMEERFIEVKFNKV